MEDNQITIPTILINDLEVIEVDNGPTRKRYAEDPGRRRKRIAAKHDVNSCGCLNRDSIGGTQLRYALYDFAEEQDKVLQQRFKIHADEFAAMEASRDAEINAVCALMHGEAEQVVATPSKSMKPTSESSVAVQRWIGSLTHPLKRAFDVAFPSTYYDREACLNFYRDRSRTTEADCTEDDDAAPDTATGKVARDSDDAMSDAGSEISIVSTTSVTYDFKNSHQEISYCHIDDIFAAAPHKIEPQDKTLLYPTLAENVRRKYSPRPHQAPSLHPLQPFLSTMEYAPNTAFDEQTGGLKRSWLYKERPEFFTSKGDLQDYMMHRGKPPGLSETMWLWLCGRDHRLPRYGPDQVALSITIHSIGKRGSYGGKNSPGEAAVREMTADYALDFEKSRSWREGKQGNGRSLWDKMLRGERKAREAQKAKPGRSMGSTIAVGVPQKRTVHEIAGSDIFQRAGLEIQWQVLNNELYSKLQDSRFRTIAGSIMDVLHSYSIEKVANLLQDTDAFWREVTALASTVPTHLLSPKEVEHERASSELFNLHELPTESLPFTTLPVFSITQPSPPAPPGSESER